MPTVVDKQKNKGATNAQGVMASAADLIAFKHTLNPKLRGFKESDVEPGSIWLVRVIEAGESLNGPVYTETALQAAAPVFEGSPVYLYKWGSADPSKGAGHLGDDVALQEPRGLVGNLVGSLEGVHWNDEAKALDGYLKVYDGTLRERMLAAYKLGDIGEGGSRDLFGLSIDAQGDKAADGRTVMRITSANSVDVVTSPAAGGRIRRLVAAYTLGDSKAEAKPYKHPEQGDGYAVFLAGKPVEWYRDKDDAERAAELKARLVLTESVEEATQSEPKEATVPELKTKTNDRLRENAAKVAAELKSYADKLSSASDADVGAMLAAIQDMLGQYMDEYAGMAAAATGGIEEATGKHANAPNEQGNPDKSYLGMAAKKYQGALPAGDDFARMTAGVEAALKHPAIAANADLRESLEAAIGKTEKTEAELQVEALQERLAEQAIRHGALSLKEDMGLHDLDTVLDLMDRSGVRVTEDYTKVEGLKEAIETLLKAKPYLGSAWLQAQAQAEQVKEAAPAKQKKAAAATSTRVTETLGQNVALRESVETGGETMDRVAGQKEMLRLRKRMLKGDTKAAVRHRQMREAMGL